MKLFDLALKGLHQLDPETAHGLTLWALRAGLYPRAAVLDEPILEQSLWGLSFTNPVGLAAGFDKDAVAPRHMLRLGFGFCEVGTITPKPQPGNSRPRLFRLPQDGAVINRNGFNSAGADVGFARLRKLRQSECPGIIGLNLGANKDSEDRVADYVGGVRNSAGLADYYVINVSSPNTPGLRDLQGKDALDNLLGQVQAARDAAEGHSKTPILLKIAPDLNEAELADIAEVVLRRMIDGVIISNTTIAGREDLQSDHRNEAGGLSGRPLFQPSTRTLRDFYALTGGTIPLIGVGGIENAETAYEKIRAGASLVQLYTALIYGGAPLVGEINRGLAQLLRRDGHNSISTAIGTRN